MIPDLFTPPVASPGPSVSGTSCPSAALSGRFVSDGLRRKEECAWVKCHSSRDTERRGFHLGKNGARSHGSHHQSSRKGQEPRCGEAARHFKKIHLT
uniref:Uncharacterized protein n=1 Tax=Knipowitschia caucasica TaxID=637954 RepID=A0AAV2LSJ6_KNICA